MPTEEDKQKAIQIHALFPSQEIASKMASIVVSKRPLGVGNKSCYTYYKEFYALKLKDSIDAMILSGKDMLIFKWEVHCDCDGGISRETLYKMINQAIRYLVECMDTAELKYSTWRNSVNVRRSEELGGIVIEYSKAFKMVTGASDFKGELISSTDGSTPKWLNEMRNWLESDSVKPFFREHLTLTTKQVVELKQELSEDIRLMSDVDCVSIKIIKT